MGILGFMERLPGPIGRNAPKLHLRLRQPGAPASSAKPAGPDPPRARLLVAYECLSLWVILQGFGQSTSVPLCAFFYATSTLIGALIPVPGGLGFTEGALEQQMIHAGGVPRGVSTAAMILVRLATLWFAVLVGFVALSLLRLRYPRSPGQQPGDGGCCQGSAGVRGRQGDRVIRFFCIAFVCLGACGGIVEETAPNDTYATDASLETSPTAGEAAVGSACDSTDPQCTGTADASALTCMEVHNNVPFPFGYCSQTCIGDPDCPSGSFCGISGYDLGSLARCMAPCTPGGSSCRASYTCLQVTDTAKQLAYGCWTVPTH